MRLDNLEYDDRKNVIGWYCNCDGYNDILSPISRYGCESERPVELTPTVERTIKKRGLTAGANFMPMNEQLKELHAKFFAAEKIAYKALDFDARRAHREEIEMICLEAKASLTAMDWVERDENEQLNPTQRDWLRNSRKNPNPALNDTVTVLKERKKRMSAADRLLADMQEMGVENATSLILNVEKKAKQGKLEGMTFNSGKKSNITLSELCRTEQHEHCTAKFRVGDVVHDCKCFCHSKTPTVTLADFNF
jgi:hypothetical protein